MHRESARVKIEGGEDVRVLQCVAVCCGVLQCVAVCYAWVQPIADRVAKNLEIIPQKNSI